MAIQVQIRRGTTAQNSTFTGAVGELTVDTTKDTVIVHDGSTAGGFPLAKESGSAIAATTLSATGVTTVQAGTVSAPAITTTGDTNTGIFFPAADTIAFSEGGVEAMRLDSAGNMGLGVTPSANSLAGSGYRNLEIGSINGYGVFAGNYEMYLLGNAYYNSGWKYANSSKLASRYIQTDGVHAWYTAASGTAGNTISFTQAMVLDASGNLGVGATSIGYSAKSQFVKQGSSSANNSVTDSAVLASNASGSASENIGLRLKTGAGISGISVVSQLVSAGNNALELYTVESTPLILGTNATERARITSGGDLLVGKNSSDSSVAGIELRSSGIATFTRSADTVLFVNRLTNDGTLVEFAQATTIEGSISVSGSTVSYNGGHLSRWAQTTTAKDESLVKGTVLSNLDEMNVYTDAEGNPVQNEQLNKVKVSDTEGDANVAGVFVNWTHDDAHDVDEINMAMTGDMIIRIAQGTTVQRGDLLMSAGDGTAKPQGDDIVRSKTVAKVTSTHVTCTYADGSFCVPCVLMAC